MPRLVVFAPNWLGDTVMALPAIADVRGPCLSVTRHRGPCRDRPALQHGARHRRDRRLSSGKGDGVFSAGDEKGVPPLFDTAILLPNSFQAALTAWRAGIPERWGYRTDWRRPLLTRAIDPPAGVHQVEYLPAPGQRARFIRPVPFSGAAANRGLGGIACNRRATS